MYFWEGQPCETDIFDLGLKVWFKLKTKVIILLNILIKVNYIDNGNGLLTRKYISLDNPLWKWICFPWLLFFFISFLFLEASFISELDVSACLLWRFCFYRILLPTFVSNFPSPHLGWHLLFLGQGEMSPGGDGHPAIAGIAASAHDAQPVIVTHSAIASVAELIDFIWFWIRRLNGW